MHCPLGLVTERAFLCCVYSVTISVSGFHLGHPTYTHIHTHTHARKDGEAMHIYALFMWAYVGVCHLCSRINKCLRRELNFLLPHPEVCTKVNVPLAAPPRRYGKAAGRCEYVSQHAKLPVKYFPNIFTHTHSHT